MRRLLIAIALWGLFASPALAQDLVLRRVMLSSGGLGYFEYEAAVDGDAALKLSVPLEQVDDVLKSLVVYDDKGGVGGLSLPGREPLRQAFKDLPFDESALQSPATLLSAVKGAEISVRGERAMSGRIASVEEETVPSSDGREATKRTRVTLLTDHGLQQFVLEEAESFQFTDPGLRDKVGRALQAIAANNAKEARTLELSTRGDGKRTVRVAYIVAVPVWKASYRLTLPAGPAAPKAALQGWATIENLSGQDWKDVELTLTSGQPVAFHQALYEAYYVTRPEVPIEVAGKLMPGVDRGGVAADGVARSEVPAGAPAPAQMNRMGGKPANPALTAAPPMAGAAEQVQAADAATQVTFKFPRPVSLAGGRTLSIPIIDREAPAVRLALYDSATAARNPLAAVRLSNDGESGLPPGILTIYERGEKGAVSYVGDARLSGFPVGETRLLAYALDEKVVIERETAQTQHLATGTIANGVLNYASVVRQATTYRIRGPAKEPRQLIVVQKRWPGWTLVKPDAKGPDARGIEISEGNYRFPLQLPGGDQTEVFEVALEQTTRQELRLVDGKADQIKVLADAKEFDDKTRQALIKVMHLQQAVAEAERKVAKHDADRQQIVQEQARSRDNLARVPANSDLQRRYLAMLDKQETELDGIAKQRAEDEKAVEAARDALRAFVAQLG